MNVTNLTPHAVRIIRAGGDLVIPPSGAVARVAVTTTPAGEIAGIPVVTGTYGPVTGLPEATEGAAFLVSALVRTAVPARRDVFSPADLVRDDKGTIVGARALEGNL